MSDPAERARLLTLSEAADFVGVHPSTLRDWAERGIVTHLRTPGGHRRFFEQDLQAFLMASRQGGALVPATREIEARTLAQIHSGVPADASWRGAHDSVGIEQKREQGRRLLGLALHYVSRQSGRDAVIAEAEEIGREYGHDAVARHIPLPETVHAFYFFRDSLIRSARPTAPNEEADDEDLRIHRDLRVFLDAVFFAMLAAFEAHMRVGPTH
jgi:excisionase family DNA binding protein